MAKRSRFTNVSFEDHFLAQIKAVLEERVLGYKSQAEFLTEAGREKLSKLHELGLHPWSLRFQKRELKPKYPKAPETVLVVAIAALALLGGLFASTNTLTGAVAGFGTFERALWYLNFVPQLYRDYSLAIDFILGFILFMALALRVFKSRAIALALGLALAFALSLLEFTTGINLSSLGAYAAFIVSGVLLYLVFAASRSFGLGFRSSIGVAVVITLFSVLSTGSSDFGNEIVGLLHIVLIIVVVYVIVSAFRGRHAVLSIGTPELAEYYPSLKEEKRVVGIYLGSIARKAQKSFNGMRNEIAYLLDLLKRFGDSASARAQIAKKIQEIPARHHPLQIELKRLKESIRQVEAQELKMAQKLSKSERKKVSGELGRKIVDAEQVRRLESMVEEQVSQFQTCMQNAVQSCAAGDGSGAEDWLRKGMAALDTAEKKMERIRKFLAAMEADTASEMIKVKKR